MKIHKQVIAKLRAEGLTIESPWEDIRKVLSQTVMPTRCIQAAKDMRACRGGDCLINRLK